MRIKKNFYTRNVLEVAPELLGKKIVLNSPSGLLKYSISEVEAYNGIDDLACHASKGKTKRTEVMYHEGGVLYMYLIYGIHWMMNIVTGPKDNPQAILIRGVDENKKPGKITKQLNINGSYNSESLIKSDRIWLEYADNVKNFKTGPRIGIDYAGEPWVSMPWRYYL